MDKYVRLSDKGGAEMIIYETVECYHFKGFKDGKCDIETVYDCAERVDDETGIIRDKNLIVQLPEQEVKE